MRTGKTIFYMLCLLCGWQVSAQELAVSESLPVDGKEGRYVEKAGNQALIYAGELEPLYLNRLEGHPYLDTKDYRKGTLAFDGIVYPGVEMRLNVYLEKLIVLSPDRRLHVIVPSERIRFVHLPGYDLYYMEPKGEKRNYPEGFYVRLYAGKYALWKRSTKGLERRMEELTLTDLFVEKISYYICRDGVYYPVSGKRSLFNLFKENKNELKRYIKERRLSFGDERERSLIDVVEYCETLNLR